MKSSAYVTSSLPALVAAWLLAGSALAAAPGGEMSDIPAATFAPLYSPETTAAAAKDVPAFRLDKRPVTNAEYAAFVAAHPEWARDRAPKLFRDESYLRHWATATKAAPGDTRLPVVNVSWYAARAYCKAQGKRLPSEIEWERAAAAGRKQPDMRNEPGAQREMLTWYTAPAQARLRAVGGGEPNYWGLYDLHSLVWEWVDDFNASLTTGDNRADADEDRQLFCGGAAGMAGDRADYAAYQRFAFRSSLQPAYTGKQLGFRCAAAAGDPVADSLYWLGSTWTTDAGTPVTLRAWEGKPVVLVMLYTSCKAACPIMIEDLKGVQAKLTPEEREGVAFVIASLDPKGDTPAQLAKFKAKVPQAKAWTFLHGSDDAVRELAAALGIRYRWMGDDLMHTNLITVLDRQGRIGHQTMGLRAPPDQTVDAIRGQLKKP